MIPEPHPNRPDVIAMLEVTITEPYTPARGWSAPSGPDGTVRILHVEDHGEDREPTEYERVFIRAHRDRIIQTVADRPPVDDEPLFTPEPWSIL